LFEIVESISSSSSSLVARVQRGSPAAAWGLFQGDSDGHRGLPRVVDIALAFEERQVSIIQQVD